MCLLKLLLQLKQKSAISLDSFNKQKLFTKTINYVSVIKRKKCQLCCNDPAFCFVISKYFVSTFLHLYLYLFK